MNKILIIEDDRLVTSIYQSKFNNEGFNVDTASDGQEGYDKISSFKPNVVLLDLTLPKKSGMDILRDIRGNPQTKDLPVIVMTNGYVPGQIETAWKGGASKCLKKVECSPKILFDTVSQLLAPPSTPAAPSTPTPAPRVDTGGVNQGNVLSLLSEITDGFPSRAELLLVDIRNQFNHAIRVKGEAEKAKELDPLANFLQKMSNLTTLVGMREFAQFSSALEAFVHELNVKPKHINLASFRTVAHAIDLIGDLIEMHRKEGFKLHLPPPNILIVDDDATSRILTATALGLAELNSINVDCAKTAIAVTRLNRFDLIFLDVDMPEITGYDLYNEIRKQEQHREIPIVFVTGITDFEHKTYCEEVGASDFITKPFLLTELTVKSMMHLIRSGVKKAHAH